jgi:hypothetical protein
VGFRLAVDPEWEVAGRAMLPVEVDGTEVVPPGPGFRSIAARFSRGACYQLSHPPRDKLDGLTMEGAPSDFTPTLAFLGNPILGSPTPNSACSTLAADEEVRVRPDAVEGGMGAPVLSADDLFCRGAYLSARAGIGPKV